MAQLTVRLRCPVDPDDTVSGRMAIVSQWLPLSEEDWFSVEAAGLEFLVWFDEDCVGLFEDLADLEIERQVNLWLHRIGLDVKLPRVSDDLEQFIYEEADRPQREKDPPDTEKYRELRDQYEKLGKQVQEGAILTLNRVIDFIRVQKGQYILNRHELDPKNTYSFFVETRAKVKAKGEWIRWRPPPHRAHTVVRGFSRWRYLTEDEWPDLIEFVRGPRSTPAVLDFLSRAEALAEEGYDRSAIVEAISALETALYDFARYPDRENLDAVSEHAAAHRIDFNMLHDLIEDKLGLRGSLGHLLPVLLPADLLSDETLERCRKAYTVRVEVVHHRRRSVDEDELRDLLKDVRELSEILLDLTDPPTPAAEQGM